jgi:hypothetical protein
MSQTTIAAIASRPLDDFSTRTPHVEVFTHANKANRRVRPRLFISEGTVNPRTPPRR